MGQQYSNLQDETIYSATDISINSTSVSEHYEFILWIQASFILVAE